MAWRIQLAIARLLREAGGVLVQRRRLHYELANRVAGHVASLLRLRRCLHFLLRAAHVFVQVVFEIVDREAREQRRAACRQLGQVGFRQQRKQQMAAAYQVRLRQRQRGDQPRVLQQRRQMPGKHWRARAAALESCDLAAQVAVQRRQADTAFARDQHKIGLLLFQQCQEQVFDVDFVLAESHANIGGAGGGQAGGFVQFRDQGFQVDAHADAPLAL
jgi:hypothetical protein